MEDPVVDNEGNSYERSAIEQWLLGQSTSPVTRSPLHATDLRPNRALKDMIDEWRDAGGTQPPVEAEPAAAEPAAAELPPPAFEDADVGLRVNAIKTFPGGQADEVLVLARCAASTAAAVMVVWLGGARGGG